MRDLTLLLPATLVAATLIACSERREPTEAGPGEVSLHTNQNARAEWLDGSVLLQQAVLLRHATIQRRAQPV